MLPLPLVLQQRCSLSILAPPFYLECSKLASLQQLRSTLTGLKLRISICETQRTYQCTGMVLSPLRVTRGIAHHYFAIPLRYF